MIARYLLITPLLLLIGCVAASFWAVREQQEHAVARQGGQLTFGEIGEPETLNPITSSTAAASDIQAYVFNGLVKADENLELTGDLAESWVVTQDSVAFFEDADAAAAAFEQLEAARDRWPEMRLSKCDVDGRTLRLHLADPAGKPAAGTAYTETLFEIVDQALILPVSVLTVAHDPGAKLPDGTEAKEEAVRDVLRARARDAGAEVHELLQVAPTVLHVSIIGDGAAYREALSELTEGEEAPLGILDHLDQALLNEPTLTFRLRKGVRWHDGHPFTSKDVAFTFRSMLDPQYKSPRSSSFWPVKEVATPDAHTFAARYRYPYGQSVLSWAQEIIPAHILEGKDAAWWAANYNDDPVGTGPFKLAEWQRNEFLRLEDNPDYFEGAPNLNAIVYRVIPDKFGNRVAFESGEFDLRQLDPHQVEDYRREDKFEVFGSWGRRYTYIGWNLKKPMFADRRVRVALAHAINIEPIVKYVYHDLARQSKGTFAQGSWYASDDVKPYPYDKEKARELLAEAGWTDTDGDGWLDKDGKRFEFNLITNQGNSLRKNIQLLVQNDLKEVGIKVNTAVYEWAVFITRYIDTRQFDACVLGWSLGINYDQYTLWHSSQTGPNQQNHCSYRNERVDELLVRIRTEFDRERIAELCAEMQEIIYRDQPYAFLVQPYLTHALYRGKFVVRRPDGEGGWIVEPVRSTEAGFTYYSQWWAPAHIAPELAR